MHYTSMKTQPQEWTLCKLWPLGDNNVDDQCTTLVGDVDRPPGRLCMREGRRYMELSFLLNLL